MARSKYILFSALLLLSLCAISAMEKGSPHYEIEKDYAIGEGLRGWINLSFDGDASDELLRSNYFGNISLLDFLIKNKANYTCSPENCGMTYSFSGESTEKSVSIDSGKSALIGFKLVGTITKINSINFSIDSTAGKSCILPLSMDILDDGEEDWRFNVSSGSFGICTESKGACFNNSQLEIALDTGLRCEKIVLLPESSYKIGAWVRKNGTAVLTAYLYSSDDLSSPLSECTLPDASTDGGYVGCVIYPERTDNQEYFICINADKDSDYTTQYEQSGEKCGFYDIDAYLESSVYNSDYNIFAQKAEYAEVEKIAFDNSQFISDSEITLEEYVWNYLLEEYGADCTDSCVIPIRLNSGALQTVDISEISINYNSDIKNNLKNNFAYNIEETPASITSDFAKLDLAYSNITIDKGNGISDLKLYLDDESLFSESIKISNTSGAFTVSPTITYPGISTEFSANVSGEGNITGYKWNFGDGEEETTSTNKVSHTYTNKSTYTLTVTLNKTGSTSIGTFEIKVVDPEEFVNSTIYEYKKIISNLTAQISSAPSWLKLVIEQKLGLNDSKAQVENLEKEFLKIDSDSSAILAELLQIQLPQSIINKSSSGRFLPNPENINPAYITSESGDYKEPIATWMAENIETNVDSQVYYSINKGSNNALLTYVQLRINPKRTISTKTSLVIDKSIDEIIFKENYGEKASGAGTVIEFSALNPGEEKIIEFVLPGEVSITELPIYISPAIEYLPGGVIDACDNDGKCDKADGETAENCINDCTGWWAKWKLKIILWIAIFFLVFCAYIILQEWYKRYYEGHLFKKKSDLYNLIYFIINAVHQGISKGEIIHKLRSYKWTREQIIYAYKKAFGKRTGMLEIPIFRGFEKRKVQEEMAKRQGTPLQIPTA